MATRSSVRLSVLIRRHLTAFRDQAGRYIDLIGRALGAAARRLADSMRANPRTSAAAVSLMALGLLLAVVRLPESAEPERIIAQAGGAAGPVAEVASPRSLAEGILLDVPALFDESAALAVSHRARNGDQRSNGAWQTVTVQSGETLEVIFRRLDLAPGLLHQVVNLDDDTRKLTRIRPGDTFDFDICPDNGFRAMRASLDEENWLLVEQADEGLATRVESRALERRPVEATAEITSSLFNAGKQAGLHDNTILQMARIFGWDIDFALDIRAGDRFAVIYEEIYRDGEYLRDGSIVAARFTNQGRTYEAVRFEVDGKADYYAPDGRPMRQAFLRAPLDFTRVSSDFNPRRLHPVTRRMRPHNGTDYAAPTGTPIWAAGDGRVIESAYNRANGNYIFIQHGNNIVTRYLHLSKRHVNRGDRVRQGDTIGLVGATGLATGPHLHYEFLVEGVHRNPRTVELPQAEPLEDRLLAEFRHQAMPLLAQLKSLENEDHLMLAQRSEENTHER